ncbi:uncharacterized protein LOC119449950 [Dermacentor silvarum]|uniref:uncharacterized protein LOC119449950 n=1 Tax=Dermacentor silvarum TaxID=543639 RepID=UPI00210167C2|nr:uncharacterized protein LOC119449950 [Dermacentor silvarum]
MRFGQRQGFGTVLLLLCVFASLAKAAVFVQPVDVKNKQCIWKKYAIPDGAHINLANPCMSLTCDSRLKYLRGASCGRVSLQGYPKNCTLKKGKGIYPKCLQNAHRLLVSIISLAEIRETKYNATASANSSCGLSQRQRKSAGAGRPMCQSVPKQSKTVVDAL